MSSLVFNIPPLFCWDYADCTVSNSSQADSELGEQQSMATHLNVPHLPAPEPLSIFDLLLTATEGRISHELWEESDIAVMIMGTISPTNDHKINVEATGRK